MNLRFKFFRQLKNTCSKWKKFVVILQKTGYIYIWLYLLQTDYKNKTRFFPKYFYCYFPNVFLLKFIYNVLSISAVKKKSCKPKFYIYKTGYTHVYIYFSYILFYPVLSQVIRYSSLCCTAEPQLLIHSKCNRVNLEDSPQVSVYRMLSVACLRPWDSPVKATS